VCSFAVVLLTLRSLALDLVQDGKDVLPTVLQGDVSGFAKQSAEESSVRAGKLSRRPLAVAEARRDVQSPNITEF
jgi:hypothetical protein